MCAKDTKNRRGRFTCLNSQGVKYIRDEILNGKIVSAHVKRVLDASGKTYRVLDIGCGDFPYLREDTDSERLLSVFSPSNNEVRAEFFLIDPDAKIQIPQGWKEFTTFVPCRFHQFLEDNKYSAERNKKFDLIILSAVPHELYLEWCLSRIIQKKSDEEEKLKKVAVASCNRKEFCDHLFRKLSALLNVEGYILLVENYCPKRVKQEAQLQAQQIQYALINHADSPSAFFPTEEYVDIAQKIGFECDFQDSVRCVNQDWIHALNNNDIFTKLDESIRKNIKLAFEGRRFGCKLIRKVAECPSDVDYQNDSELRRGFLFDMSSVVNFDELDKVLHEWVDAKTGVEDIKTKYKDVFWQSAKKSVFSQLIKKCYDVVKRTFSYEIITYPKLFSCWVSINSLVAGGRFCSVDKTGRMTPILCTDEGVKVYMREEVEFQDWNEIAFNFFSSVRALEELLSKSGLNEDVRKIARSPSVYNYMRHTPCVRSLTLTYARQLSSNQASHIPADIQLATQEDAINALELGHWQSKPESLEEQKHRLIVIDFKKRSDDKDETDSCLRAAEEINKFMIESGGYYTDVEDKNYVEYLTALYLDFLFLRRFENENEKDIGKLIDDFKTRWENKIRDVFDDGDGVGKKFLEIIAKAIDAAKGKHFQIVNLPRAFVTFSAPIYLDENGDESSADRKKQPPGSMMIFTDKLLPKDALDSMVAVTEHTFDVIRALELKWVVEKRNQELLLSNTKSAIGSIMSRNGSHNIGSHVLAALSHNVGTMPDDRVLYQYIQQRMDYIATATTDFPAWRQLTMLVSGMLREFLIQRHLLDHIAGSEGLRAYQFQNRSLAPNQNNTIRIHIRRIKDDVKNWVNNGFLSCVNGEIVDDNSCVVPFINYRSESGAYSALKDNKDIAVAIPGGVVGQHAFYTILENIVRNAAKHDWAKADKADSKYANLELYIDFRDNPKEGLVEFRVWTCVIGFKQKVGTTIVHAKRIGIGNSGESVLNEITKKVCQCFIDADGGLRKENWGIAEMRISAGYLRNCDIADIGGLNNCGVVDNDCETIKIIRPVNVSLPDATEALGYRFDLYKPRELLVVLPESCNCSSSVLECANQNANQYGVWVKRECDLVKEVNLSFSYVLFDVFDINNEYRQCLPFRVIATKIVSREIKANNDSDDSKKGGGCLSSAKRLIPEIGSPIFKYIGSVDDLSDVDKLAKDERTAKVLCESLLERVYGIWVSHVAKDKIATENPALAIYVAGGGNEKKSLVTKFDLLRFVLENSFNAAAKSFLDIGLAANVPNSTTGSVAVDGQNSGELKSNALFTKVLNGIIALKPRDVSVSFNEGSESPGQSLKLLALSDVLRRQIQSWFCALYGMTTDSLKCYKEFTSSKAYKAFISYICGPILSQAEVFLSKYEEDYSTLPLDFKIEVDKNDECVPQPYIYCGKQKVEVEYSNDDKQCLMRYDEGYMCYLRHSPGLGGDIGNYLEPLSGSQSYLGAFVALRDNLLNNVTSINDKRFVVSLVENAAMRILIIDERVKDFMDNHNEVRRKLGGLGIAVMDDDDSEVINLFDAINIDGGGGRLDDALSVHVSGVALKDFEVLIIHQGIIDKLLNGHENVEVVREFLKALISRMKYVVVATGRGSPANIPDEARVLPYSVIKDTLLKCYPEKMILVGAVMNILSVRNTKGG